MKKTIPFLVALILSFALGWFFRGTSLKTDISIHQNPALKLKVAKTKDFNSKKLEPKKESSLKKQEFSQNKNESENSIQRKAGDAHFDIEKYDRRKRALLKKKKAFVEDHPGRVKEMDPGTEMPDGTVAGEVEASLFIEHFEKDLFEKLKDMDSDELRDKYAYELSWFQRVGNFRKGQKCRAILKMQMDFKLEPTSFDDCIANIMLTEKETWGKNI